MAFLLARYLIGDFVSGLLRGKSRKWDMVSLQIQLPISADTSTVVLLIGRSAWLCMMQCTHHHLIGRDRFQQAGRSG